MPWIDEPVFGLRADESLGVVHYADRLAEALNREGVAYRTCERAAPVGRRHFHLANSSRGALLAAAGPGVPYILTIHDVIPRSDALLPLYRMWVWPWIVRRATAVIVHSDHARQLLVERAGVRARVIAHPVTVPAQAERGAARALLGWGDGPPIAVMPGVLKASKMVGEAITACRPLIDRGSLRLFLVGRVADDGLRQAARRAGAELLESPSTPLYQAAVVASDLVLVLRSGSVGEANGPLADALGAGRAIVATPSGAIPEYAGEAAVYTDTSAEAIRSAVAQAIGPDAARLEAASRERARALTWARSAQAHRSVFDEVWGPQREARPASPRAHAR